MMTRTRRLPALLLGCLLLSGPARAGEGELKSVGPLGFGPEGVMFVGDTAGAAVVAIETDDTGPRTGTEPLDVAGIDQKIAALLGTAPRDIQIHDLAVNPASGRAYLSVSRGRGPDAAPVLIRVEPGGAVKVLELDGLTCSRAELPDPPAEGASDRPDRPSARQQSITDLAYVDGRVFVAGLSNEEFSSRLLSLPYPFEDQAAQSTSVEIFHGAHGRFETRSPVRTFLPYQVDGQPYLLAAYTCTPLVKFPVSELKPGSHVKGTTIAELGNRNRPLDMIAFEDDGTPYLLLANSSRGVMKIPAGGVGAAEGIEEPVQAEREGLGYETIAALQGVEELDKLDDAHALILRRTPEGALNLETIDLP